MKNKLNMDPEKKKETMNKLKKVLLFIVCVVLIIFSLIIGINRHSEAARESYETAKEEQKKIKEQEIYDSAFKRAEEEYHVSNDMTVFIGPVNEEQKLEALKVFDIEYKVYEVGDFQNWMEIPGMGIFAIDMQQAEFIIDNENRTVFVRMPSPYFTDFTIVTEKIQVLHTDDDRTSASEGIDIVNQQLKEAQKSMMDRIKSNQDYPVAARKNAEVLITGMVHKFNPDIPDLKVSVEWID